MTDYFGGGLVFAVAAGMWLLFLIPSWMRRRSTARTESAASRVNELMQDPEGILAQTKAGRAKREELLESERIAHQKLLASKAAAREVTAQENAAIARHRRKSARLSFFILFVASLLTVGAGYLLLGYVGTPIMMYAGAGGAVAALLGFQIVGIFARRSVRLSSAPAPAPQVRVPEYRPVEQPEVDPRAWVPRPLPKPASLQAGSLAAATVAQMSVAERIRQAARAEALRARLDDAAAIAQTRSVRPEPVREGAPVEVAMSDVLARATSAGESSTLDLDEVFRRRAAG